MIVLGIAIPSVSNVLNSFRLQTAGEQVSALLNTARAQATEENRSVTVAFVGGTNQFGLDTSNPRDGVPDAVLFLPEGITLVAASNPPCSQPVAAPGTGTITFGSRGDLVLTPLIPNSVDCIRLQNRRGARTVRVSLRGRVSTE